MSSLRIPRSYECQHDKKHQGLALESSYRKMLREFLTVLLRMTVNDTAFVLILPCDDIPMKLRKTLLWRVFDSKDEYQIFLMTPCSPSASSSNTSILEVK